MPEKTCSTCQCNKVCDHNKYGFENCGNYISADLALRAEVAREIFDEIEELAKIYTFPVVKNGVIEIAKEPFWCIEPNALAELKKKYTEERSK